MGNGRRGEPEGGAGIMHDGSGTQVILGLKVHCPSPVLMYTSITGMSNRGGGRGGHLVSSGCPSPVLMCTSITGMSMGSWRSEAPLGLQGVKGWHGVNCQARGQMTVSEAPLGLKVVVKSWQ